MHNSVLLDQLVVDTEPDRDVARATLLTNGIDALCPVIVDRDSDVYVLHEPDCLISKAIRFQLNPEVRIFGEEVAEIALFTLFSWEHRVVERWKETRARETKELSPDFVSENVVPPMLCLSTAELIELTGRHQAAAQGRILNSLGIDHRVRPDGSIVVLRNTIEQPVFTARRRSHCGPDLDALAAVHRS